MSGLNLVNVLFIIKELFMPEVESRVIKLQEYIMNFFSSTL